MKVWIMAEGNKNDAFMSSHSDTLSLSDVRCLQFPGLAADKRDAEYEHQVVESVMEVLRMPGCCSQALDAKTVRKKSWVAAHKF